MSRLGYKTIYLTGAPAAGKSTLVRHLQAIVSPLDVFVYGEELTRHISTKTKMQLDQEDLRRQSSDIISARDVAELDEVLIRRANAARMTSHFIVDSHPVTKESYGFRITPFTYEQLEALSPTAILMLYNHPQMTLERLEREPAGRPMITAFEAALHVNLQASVAIGYALHVGVPIYLFDSGKPPDELAEVIARKVGLLNGSVGPMVGAP